MSQIKIGAILSYISIVVTMLVTLVYTPLLIRMLGQSEYGLYALIVSFAGYLSILDMGLGNAIVRYIARNRALGNLDEESKLTGLFIKLFLIVGFVTILIGFTLAYNVDAIFGKGLTDSELDTAKIMIVILTFNFALSFPLSVFGAIIQAYEKFVFIKIAAMLKLILQPILILIVLMFNYGIVSMVLISSIINIVFLIINFVYCKKYLNTKISFASIDKMLIKEILVYSSFVFLTVIVDKIYWQTDQVLLGIFKDTETVAVYALSIQFIAIFLTLSTAFSSLFLPKISMMVAKKIDSETLSNLFIKIGRIQYLILGYVLSGFIIFGRQFIELWVGNDYKEAYIITLILLVPFMIDLIQNVGIIILQARNLFLFRTIVLIISSILNILISIPILKIHGSIGTALVTAIFIFLGNGIIMNLYFSYKLNLKIKLFWGNILNLSLTMTFATLFYYLFIRLIKLELTYWSLLLEIIIFSIIFFMFIWIFGMNNNEKNIIRRIIYRGYTT